MIQIYDRWVKAEAAVQVSGVVLLDLSAAFDFVDPVLLLQKLKIYGLDDSKLHWIESYLTGIKGYGLTMSSQSIFTVRLVCPKAASWVLYYS